jgi:hypothetical protein
MAKHDLPTVRRGDTYNGSQFTLTVNSSPLDLTGASIKMDMRLTEDGVSEKRFETGGKGITIATPPTAGIFSIDQQIIDTVDFGNFFYDIEITLQNGEVKTYVWGIWPIAEDITHDN